MTKDVLLFNADFTMMTNKEIQLEDIWNDKKREGLKQFIAIHSANQSEEEKLEIQRLANQYTLEDEIQNKANPHEVRK